MPPTPGTALPQGDLGLLDAPVARELLTGTAPAHLGYLATDGSPRVVPTWFHWTGDELVTVTYVAGPGVVHPARRLAALRADPRVAVTVDDDGPPPRVLTLRGKVTVEEVRGVAPEYAAAARRYLGTEAADEMLAELDHPRLRQARIGLRPQWVGLLDFTTRLPSAQGGLAPEAGRPA
ncbi:pyridoxamine 5'-phosphate oxidase family protein [Cellulomonas telluris]|uniref:pyridoxamine 5'-phosphate oxidase family protein n=1 Tax=Cellulomonas telluris TaxID=2306636 RepID=UPI0010A83095|nr:pyridoxamine 5'-phosphate oxidase family protein [Cellulomonas telluris]